MIEKIIRESIDVQPLTGIVFIAVDSDVFFSSVVFDLDQTTKISSYFEGSFLLGDFIYLVIFREQNFGYLHYKTQSSFAFFIQIACRDNFFSLLNF